jgi:hypothetical protein
MMMASFRFVLARVWPLPLRPRRHGLLASCSVTISTINDKEAWSVLHVMPAIDKRGNPFTSARWTLTKATFRTIRVSINGTHLLASWQ